ncbi:MAG: hypothetical protein M3Y60_00565 [Bacteroidota bacterium]|nr:hypothetical protein [Bacteroidota bacterium]
MQERIRTQDTSQKNAPVSNPVLPDPIATEFARFIEYHPAKDFRRNLRKMLMEFLMRDRAMESVYLKDLLYDIDGLFDLLDVIEANIGDSG